MKINFQPLILKGGEGQYTFSFCYLLIFLFLTFVLLYLPILLMFSLSHLFKFFSPHIPSSILLPANFIFFPFFPHFFLFTSSNLFFRSFFSLSFLFSSSFPSFLSFLHFFLHYFLLPSHFSSFLLLFSFLPFSPLLVLPFFFIPLCKHPQHRTVTSLSSTLPLSPRIAAS